VQHRGGGAERNHVAGQAGGAQALGGGDGGHAFGLRDALHVLHGAAGVGMAGMGQDAGAGTAEAPGDVEQGGAVGGDAATALATIDLDQRARRRGVGGDGGGDGGVIGDDHDVGAAGVQLRHRIELLWRDADRVQDVAEAVAGEVLGFGEGGDGDAARARERRVQGQAGDVHRLGRLHVRPERDPVAGDGAGHGVEVALQDSAVEDQAGRGEVGELHGDSGVSSARSRGGRAGSPGGAGASRRNGSASGW
jgi:hypothetical protein